MLRVDSELGRKDEDIVILLVWGSITSRNVYSLNN